MDEGAITELLNELHAKLESASTITDRERELLMRLSRDIQSLLAHPGGPTAKHRSIIDGLRESIVRFEVSHPDLTDVMARISQVLADMGI